MNSRIISCICLLLLDFLWIGLFMGKKYKKQILKIQGTKMKVNIMFAVFAYILMVIGMCIFVIPNIRKSHAFVDSLLYGLTFGLVLYGVYDFTIGAVLTNWNIQLAIIDIIWGGFVFFISSFIGVKLSN
jgi:uncharacterized membrane protein